MTLAPPLSQQVRQTETWVPLKTTQTAAMLAHRDLEGSASDFGFTDEDDADSPYDDDDGELDYDDFSGSGDAGEDTPLPPLKPMTPVTFETLSFVSIETSVTTGGGSGPSEKVRKASWRRAAQTAVPDSSPCLSPAARGHRQPDS